LIAYALLFSMIMNLAIYYIDEVGF